MIVFIIILIILVAILKISMPTRRKGFRSGGGGYVKGHYRKDGSYVEGHYRNRRRKY